MSNQKTYTANAIPLPFGRFIEDRPESNRLPLEFKRPWGYADTGQRIPHDPNPESPKRHEPYRPPEGYAAVAQSWGVVQAAGGFQTACAVQQGLPAAMRKEYAWTQGTADRLSACIHPATVGMDALAVCQQPRHLPSAKLNTCHQASVGALADLRRCQHPLTTAATALVNCAADADAAQSAALLKTVFQTAYSADAAVQACAAVLLPPPQAIAACVRPVSTPALPVPCEYYELPAEPEPQPADKTYICGLRPPSNRMALRFSRKKSAHSARYLPVAFSCGDVLSTPIREAYIMHNTVTASVDGLPLGLFSASFACDTGGYCWQGSLTVSPDDFAKINMAGRVKGDEAVISCQINGDSFVILAEDYSDNRRFGQKSYTVSGRSLTARLGDDYAAKGSETYRAPMYAQQIAAEQLRHSGFTVDGWHITDWLIPENVYSATDKSPMAVLQELAAAAGGFVCSDTVQPALRLKPKWPRAAWEIESADADVTVPAGVILSISGRHQAAERAEAVFVWPTHAHGKAADVYRRGSSRAPRASALSHALYTDQPVLLAAGIAALSATGTHKHETVRLPVSDKYALPLAELGQIWQIHEPTGAWKGVVTGVSLEVQIEGHAPTVEQSVVIDRYLDR